MADVRGAWNDTGDKLTELGRKLKVHYEEQHGAEAQLSRQELTDAARRVGGALQDAFEAIGSAARDDSVKADVKQVGQSLVEALGATLGQASDELRRAFSERKGTAATPGTPVHPVAEAHPEEQPGEPEQPGETDVPPPGVEPWGTP